MGVAVAVAVVNAAAAAAAAARGGGEEGPTRVTLARVNATRTEASAHHAVSDCPGV